MAIVIGVRQEPVHVTPGYEGTITTGWGGDLNHEARLLARLGLVGVGGAIVVPRWRRLAVVPAATGGVVLFYALRAALHYAFDPGLYVAVSAYGGPTRFVLGAEPVPLVVGGTLLVVAGITGRRDHPDRADGGGIAATPSTR